MCLARLPVGVRVPASQLAQETLVPPAYLSKILRNLVRSGLVHGTKGHHGGYKLVLGVDDILLGDVIAAVSDPEAGLQTCVMGDRMCDESEPCILHEIWTTASEPLTRLLRSVTVGEVVREAGTT